MAFETVRVPLEGRSYDITIGPDLISSGFAAAQIAAMNPTRVMILTHPSLLPLYAAPLLETLAAEGIHAQTALFPAGEQTKRLTQLNRCYNRFADASLDRKSLVVTVGGGVIGDLGGFAAATYLRGIRFVQVPTSLLAQVDAAVGGKTGIDLAQGKNLVGAFHQPSAVLIDTNTLQTLPRRELHAGLAEVIKYGIIYDNSMFRRIADALPKLLQRDPDALAYAISRSCAIKAEIVSQDETEQGVRALLNFGHTVGHALESLTNYRRYKHGEAVSIGMIAAIHIGIETGITPPAMLLCVKKVLLAAGLPLALPSDISDEQIVGALVNDKKTLGGRPRFVLACEMGRAQFGLEVADEALLDALRRHRAEVE